MKELTPTKIPIPLSLFSTSQRLDGSILRSQTLDYQNFHLYYQVQTSIKFYFELLLSLKG